MGRRTSSTPRSGARPLTPTPSWLTSAERPRGYAACWPSSATATSTRSRPSRAWPPPPRRWRGWSQTGSPTSCTPAPWATAQARRLRLIVLVHMSLGHRAAETGDDGIRMRERAVLSAAAAVVTTSAWTRRRLLELYPLTADRLHVAPPGVDPAELAVGTAGGG